MSENINNNSNINLNTISNFKIINSDKINIKNDFNNGLNNNIIINNKSSIYNQNNINIKNTKKCVQRKYIKLKKIKKHLTKDNINKQNSLENLKKSKTQTNFFNWSNSLNPVCNFPDIHFFSLNKNTIDKNLNKTNSFCSDSSKNKEINKVIYFNSTLNNFYKINNNFFNLKSSEDRNSIKKSLILPPSDKVSFISNILKTYKKSENNKNRKNILKNIRKNNEKKEEEINKKIFKGFSFLSMNKAVLETLFKKTPLKIKTGVLTSIEDENIKSHIRLNPFLNSYGYILDDLSEKIGFIKGSINMIYPKISKAKYLCKEFDKTEDNELYNKRRPKIIKIKSKSLEGNNNIYEKKIKLYNDVKPKIIIKKFFSKYPINRGRNGENDCSSKMYSFKKKRFFIEKN